MKEFENCMLCPRECGVNRLRGELGYCHSDASFQIASICLHHGEEPAISGRNGICNVFFRGCNLQCIFCQNYQISHRKSFQAESMSLENVVEAIVSCLDRGAEAVGFVSPTHFMPHVQTIIRSLHSMGYHPVTVYNTNGYEYIDIIKSLEDSIDVYLPDIKYFNPVIAKKWSGANDYPAVVRNAISEMYRQKGNTVVLSDSGQAMTGMIIRHLVLPGQVDDSIEILRWIAGNLSTSVHLSLMSQYFPTSCVSGDPYLHRRITAHEYDSVVEEMDKLGFENGWVQALDSSQHYNPDFTRRNPFE